MTAADVDPRVDAIDERLAELARRLAEIESTADVAARQVHRLANLYHQLEDRLRKLELALGRQGDAT